MIFTVLGAVAELERSLIVERCPGGSKKRTRKGKDAGQARKIVDAATNCELREQGFPGRRSEPVRVGEGTVYRLAHASRKTPSEQDRKFVTRKQPIERLASAKIK